MRRERWAIIGDLHLKKLYRVIPNHIELQINALSFIMKRVVDEGIKKVVLLGDVFDSPIVEIEVVRALLQFTGQYPDVEFIWVCGNHDRVSLDGESHIDLIHYITQTGGASNLTPILNPTKRGRVSFLPYPFNKALSKTDLAFAHTDRPGAKRDNGTPIHTDIEWNEKITFVIGHNHTAQKIKRTHYIGTPWQCTFGEKPEKFWSIIEFNIDRSSPLDFKITNIPMVLPYQLLKLKIEKKSDFKKVLPAPVYYQLTIDPGVKLPKDWLVKHSNCRVVGKIMQRIEVEENTDTQDEESPINLTYKLEEYLIGRGLTEKQASRGLKMVEAVLHKAA